jgi:hypothetical protein
MKLQNWDKDKVTFDKHLGGNFWRLTDGGIYNTTSNIITSENALPVMMRHEQTAGKLIVYGNRYDFPKEEGTKFVVFDIVTSFGYSKSGKTKYAKFESFDYISVGWAKVGEKFKEYTYDFQLNCAYAFVLRVNPKHFDGLEILRQIKLEKNE